MCHFMCLDIHHNFISAQGKAKGANLLKEEEESLSCLDSSTGCFELNLPILAAHVTSIILTILSSKFHHERIVETPLIVLKLIKKRHVYSNVLSVFHQMATLLRHVIRFLSWFARSPEKGAETLVYLASSPQIQGASGGYYFNCKLTPPSPAAQDDGIAERLWQVSEHLVGIT